MIAVEFHEFLQAIAANASNQHGGNQHGGNQITRDTERIARTVCSALCARLDGAATTALAAQLPAPLAEQLTREGDRPGQQMLVVDFLAELADRLHTDGELARQHASAVLTVLAGAITSDGLHQLLGQLPSGYAPLFGPPTEQTDRRP